MLRSAHPYYSDAELIRSFRSGDEKAFTAVYQQFYFQVYQFAKRWLNESQDAEDVTADTFVKLWDRKAKFESLGNIGGFLYLTVRNACYDLLRHRQVRSGKQSEIARELDESGQTDFTIQQIREEFLKLVYAEVERMPAKMKEIFLLSYRDGLKPAEIARQLQLSVQTVANQKVNAIRFLKEALTDKSLLTTLLLLLEGLFQQGHS